MNTDNTSISGETIDYGPCAFMDMYDPNTVFSSIDRNGRYAYGNQPSIMQWNLARLSETLLSLLGATDEDALVSAQEALDIFASCFKDYYYNGFRRKIGLITNKDSDVALIESLLEQMATNRADFTLTFRRFCDAAISPEADMAVRTLFSDPRAYDSWAIDWRKRLSEELVMPDQRRKDMMAVNPLYIPRNHLVEAALVAAVSNKDFAPFKELLAVLSRPYEEQPGKQYYSMPPADPNPGYITFCGT